MRLLQKLDDIRTNALEVTEAIGALQTEVRRLTRERNLAEMDLVVPVVASEPQNGFATSDNAFMIAQNAIEFARQEWLMGVSEPSGQGWERIDEKYIRGELGLDWGWVPPYKKDGDFAWCGAFAAFCFGRAGLKHEIRFRHMPSCRRLYKWARGMDRLVVPSGLRVGDVVVVGPGNGKEYGAHITIYAEAVEEGWIGTIEGNAAGRSPNGTRWEGVVKQRRPHLINSSGIRDYRVLYGVRFQKEDFVIA